MLHRNCSRDGNITRCRVCHSSYTEQYTYGGAHHFDLFVAAPPHAEEQHNRYRWIIPTAALVSRGFLPCTPGTNNWPLWSGFNRPGAWTPYSFTQKYVVDMNDPVAFKAHMEKCVAECLEFRAKQPPQAFGDVKLARDFASTLDEASDKQYTSASVSRQ